MPAGRSSEWRRQLEILQWMRSARKRVEDEKRELDQDQNPGGESKLEEEAKEDAPVKERINILQKHLDLVRERKYSHIKL